MNYIEKVFKKSGWLTILEDLVFALLGIVLISHPDGTVKTISYILGAIFILVGIYKITNYISAKGKYNLYNFDMMYGIIAIVIGLVCFIYGNTIISAFRVIIGIWIMYSSFVRMNLALKVRRMNISVWFYSFILAILMFICGLFITLNSGIVIVTVGISMLIYSIIDIIETIIFMKNVKEIF